MEHTWVSIEKVLQTYSFEEILELNGLTMEDVVLFLVEQDYLELPNPEPLDFDD